MAVVPVVFSGVFYPKNKKDPSQPGTFVGNVAIAGYVPTHPIVLPPDVPEQPPTDPPLVIWGGGNVPIAKSADLLAGFSRSTTAERRAAAGVSRAWSGEAVPAEWRLGLQ